MGDQLDIKAVIGLGNPGKVYSETLHNAGFLVVQKLIEPSDSWKPWRDVAVVSWGKPILYMPQTFMNRSGIALKALLDFKKIEPSNILVICDDFSINLGEVRIRTQGSSGGQKGLQSIIDVLGTSKFPRVRVGIGPLGEHDDPADFVLRKLKGHHREEFFLVIERTKEIISYIFSNGVEKAMNKFNSARLI